MKPPKGVLNWVGQPAPGQSPPTFEARLYDVLFKVNDPGSMETWLDELNPDSLQVRRSVEVVTTGRQAGAAVRRHLC